MSFWSHFFEFAGAHPVAAFFMVLAAGWAIASPIQAVMTPWRDYDEAPNINIQKNCREGEDE